MIGMPCVGFALGSGTIVEIRLFTAALLLLAAGLLDVCWNVNRHLVRLCLTPSALVAGGLFFGKEYPPSCLFGFYSYPYTESRYFENT